HLPLSLPSMLRPPPTSPLFPYTTLFRSRLPPGRSAPPPRRPPERVPGRSRRARGGSRPPVPFPGSAALGPGLPGLSPRRSHDRRSEEHTSELQSLTNLVCRLLLEKKNT